MILLSRTLKAVGIVLVAYALLLAGVWAVLTFRSGSPGAAGFTDWGLKTTAVSAGALLYFLVPFLLAFGALSLPPRGRLYAACGGLIVILGILAAFAVFVRAVVGLGS